MVGYPSMMFMFKRYYLNMNEPVGYPTGMIIIAHV